MRTHEEAAQDQEDEDYEASEERRIQEEIAELERQVEDLEKGEDVEEQWDRDPGVEDEAFPVGLVPQACCGAACARCPF